MPQDNNRRQNIKDGSFIGGNASIVTQKVLVVVKTYPAISTKYSELVCTAGVNENGDWVRLFPIQFRDLPDNKKYKKFDWITVDTHRTPNDKRKESYKVNQDSINIVGGIQLNKNNSVERWSERNKYVLKDTSQTLCSLKQKYEEDLTSIGIIKPQNIKLIIQNGSEDWEKNKQAILSQSSLFASNKKELEKVPYVFKYQFKCNDNCPSHELTIRDWEIYMLYLNYKWKNQYAADTILQKIHNKYQKEFWESNRDSYLIVGTTHYPYKSWVVIGVYSPPKILQERLF